MSKFKLAFGIHNHQPVGNFEQVFQQAHQQAYGPFLKLVSSHKNFRMSLHQSGILWDWQKQNHPEYLNLIRKMAADGQIEIMSGGFYEPILCAIPARDVAGQIELLTKYIHEEFGTTPTGLWLTERVWEPHLPEALSPCGVQYVPVDDAHFIYAGFEKSQLTEPFVTESNGHMVTLLPIQQRLRYLIPFGTIKQLITELKIQAKENPSGLAVYADDGEKFGVWPETHKHCYTDGWLESFFEEIEKNSDWLEVIPLGEAAQRKPSGRAYLPTASYAEMLHWALPAPAFVEYEHFEQALKEGGQYERFGRFVRGGHWRNFLAKYEESNLMHKKMLHISDRLHALETNNPAESKSVVTIREHLYAGQCNCPYWHGVFGGLYLPHIRQAVYANLIDAEQRLNQLEKVSGFRVEKTDFDCDGSDEIIASNDYFSTVFKPSRGGTLLELSLLQHNFNLTDTLSRRREGYHAKLEPSAAKRTIDKTVSIHERVISKEENLHNYLVNDWYLKRCFIDHFFREDTTIENFQNNKFKEAGDFILEPYLFIPEKQKHALTFSREGNIWKSSGALKINVKKTFRFDQDAGIIKISYSLYSTENKEALVLFGIENNFNFQAGHAADRYILVDGNRSQNSYLDSTGNYKETAAFAMIDEYRQLAVAIASDQNCTLWHLPIFTVSMSEGGFEKVYQGTTFVNLYEIKLSQEPVSINLTLFSGDLKQLPAHLGHKAAFSALK